MDPESGRYEEELTESNAMLILERISSCTHVLLCIQFPSMVLDPATDTLCQYLLGSLHLPSRNWFNGATFGVWLPHNPCSGKSLILPQITNGQLHSHFKRSFGKLIRLSLEEMHSCAQLGAASNPNLLLSPRSPVYIPV